MKSPSFLKARQGTRKIKRKNEKEREGESSPWVFSQIDQTPEVEEEVGEGVVEVGAVAEGEEGEEGFVERVEAEEEGGVANFASPQ